MAAGDGAKGEDGASLHDKSAVTSGNQAALAERTRVVETAGDPVGRRSLSVYHAMQQVSVGLRGLRCRRTHPSPPPLDCQNPAILDTAAALSSSRVHRIAAAMAVAPLLTAGGGAKGKARSEAVVLALPPGTVLTDGSVAGKPSTSTPSEAAAASGPTGDEGGPASIAATTSTALAVTEASKLEALIPPGASVDALLLAVRPPTNVVSWGPRPSEGSPCDQLVLAQPEQ